MLSFTEAAKSKILKLLEGQDRTGLALRLAVKGRGPGGFQYSMGFVGPEDKAPSDVVFDAPGFEVYMDAESAPNLRGVSIDFIDELHVSGFKIDNPNSLWADATALAVQKVLDENVNPAIASHGGYVTLLDVKQNIAYIQLGGGCQGCGMVDVTLKQGIEVMIKEAVPQIVAVVDSTDHAAGENPYYQPSKGGTSPLA